MSKVNSVTARLYREYRQHQRDVQSSGGGTLTVYSSGRSELSYASAAYGEHAASAFASAKRHLAWLKRNRKAA